MRSRGESDQVVAVVRDVIHEWDPYALIETGAPADEWDHEIAAIAAEIPRVKSHEDAALVVSRVFASAFQPEGFGPADCKDVGCRLFSALRDAGAVGDGT